MKPTLYEVESERPFAESKIWQLNRDFYNNEGISAWSDDIVPHHMTSNSMVGKTYAELIGGFLKDIARKGNVTETVYILEMGAGHGRLAFHILKHLEKIIDASEIVVPPFCYVLSDIVEENLRFFLEHDQFQSYYKKGMLDVSYFDAIGGDELHLRYADKKIRKGDLQQPIIALANYFFDSIPNDLFLIKDDTISSCSVSLQSIKDPTDMSTDELIKTLEMQYHSHILEDDFYEDSTMNEMLHEYKEALVNSYLFFPKHGLDCIENLRNFSPEGLMLISMDKGYHEIEDLEKKDKPDVVEHGSMSLWVNYHAIGSYCHKQGGKAFFPSHSTFHLDIGCLLFVADTATYTQTDSAYQQFVNDFGPDDFNSIKQLTYTNITRLKTKDLLALFRLSSYDSTFFIKLLPQLKMVSKGISFAERRRIGQMMEEVWQMYFSIGETYDLAYEIGGVYYDLGFYELSLNSFHRSEHLHGKKADTYYNIALSHYQLRQDALFFATIKEGKTSFPGFALFDSLEKLDVS